MLRRLMGWLRPAGPEPATIYQPKAIYRSDHVDSFLSTYYLKPMPELVWQVLDFLGTGDNIRNCVPGTIGFLSEFIAEHQARKAQLKSLASSKSAMLKVAFSDAVRLSRRPGRALSSQGHSGQLNDLYWGAYYASGNPCYIDRVVDEMRFLDESSDPRLFLTGATARWSLASHAVTHESVRQHLEEIRASREDRIKELVNEVMTSDPPQLWAEMEATCKERGWYRAGTSPA